MKTINKQIATLRTQRITLLLKGFGLLAKISIITFENGQALIITNKQKQKAAVLAGPK